MDPRMYIGTVYRCLFENCDRQTLDKKELEKHIHSDHFNNDRAPIRQPVPSHNRRILQPLHINVPQSQPMPIVVPYNGAVVHLGGGFTAVPAANMTDSQKALRYMRFLRVPGYEQCELCTLAPCILHDIPERDVECMPEYVSEPSEDNHRERKLLYKQGWATLDNLGYFGLKEYKAVKLAHIEALPTAREQEKARASKRNPLPQCTEEAVRTFFPNPEGMPYMNFLYY